MYSVYSVYSVYIALPSPATTSYRPIDAFSAIRARARRSFRCEYREKCSRNPGISFRREASVVMSLLMIRSRGEPENTEQLCFGCISGRVCIVCIGGRMCIVFIECIVV